MFNSKNRSKFTNISKIIVKINRYYDGKSTSYYRINGFIQKLNVCYTCNIIRPPRTSHCAECDDCIERFDHHCIWIGNCVGKRNYKYFFLFLLHLNMFGVYGIIISSYVVSLKYTNIAVTKKIILITFFQ